MAEINDDEFGSIKLTRNPRASKISLKVGPDGRLRATLPNYTPVFFVKQMIKGSRPEIRELLKSHQDITVFSDSMQIGKSHRLIVRSNLGDKPKVSRHGTQIIVSLPKGQEVESPSVQSLIRPVVIESLRKEAKSYLPRRLSYLANQHEFSYKKVRFSHASGRWGSCSSSGTISLNIALMKLPFPLIDYVLVHELSHTVEMNHSKSFWSLVERCQPNYKDLRRQIKNQTPSI